MASGLFTEVRGIGILRSSSVSGSANFALKLSEKGFERRSERGIGRYIGAKIGRTVRCRCSVQLSFGCLQDFSVSFMKEFCELLLWAFSEVGLRLSRVLRDSACGKRALSLVPEVLDAY